MLKDLPTTLNVSIHGHIPPDCFWRCYTGPEIAELPRQDPDATVREAEQAGEPGTCRPGCG
jgi:hypothetical protein